MKIFLNHTAEVVLLWFLFSAPLFSQKAKTDSLLQLLSGAKDDTAKVHLLIAIAQEMQYTGGDSKKFSQEGLSLSQKLNYTYGKALSFYSLGRCDYYSSDYSGSLENNKLGYEFYRQINDSKGTAYCLMSMGDAHYSMDDFSDAISLYDRSIEIFEKIKYEVGIANCLMSKGDVCYVQDNYHEALLYYKRALEYFEKNNSMLGIANSINCIADVLYDQTDFPQAKEKYEKAKSLFLEINDLLGLGNCTKRLGDIEYRTNNLDKALEIYNDAHRYYSICGSINGVANTIRNIGEVFTQQKKYAEAIEKMNESMEIVKKTGDGMGLADCYNNLAKIYKASGETSKAIQFAEKGYRIASEIGTPEIVQVSAYELGELYSQKKQFEKAFFYQKLYTNLEDSINSNENVKKITRLQMQIDFEQKQRAQELLQKQKELEHERELIRQKTVRNSLVAGSVVLLLLSFFIYKNYRNNKKANLMLAEKNRIIELKNQEITDSMEYAEHIQKAMLVSDDVLKELFHEYFVFFKPKDIISGDFYWATALHKSESRMSAIITVADCTGHGVPGALMSVLGNTLLNKIVVENRVTTPSEILNRLRNGIIEILHQKGGAKDSKDGMDMALLQITNHPLAAHLQYAGAHNPLLIVRNNQLIELKPDNFPVGFFYGEKKSFTNHIIEVQKGDMLYLFSDGFSNQYGGTKQKKFKTSRLKELLLSMATKTAHEQKEILNKKLEDWKGNFEQVDDICIVGVRV